MNSVQLDLLKNSKKFLNSFKNKNFLPFKDSVFYLATYSNFIGSNILNSIIKFSHKNLLSRFIINLKDILFSLNYINYKMITPRKISAYNNIILTWAFENNFNKDNSLSDRYFNIQSNDLKKTLWFVIYLGKKNPKKILKNMVLLKPVTKKSFNIFHIIKILCKNLPFLFRDFNYFLTLSSNHNFFAKILIKEIKPHLRADVNKIIMPYEGQPFQNRLIHFLSKKYKKIKTIGYIHSPPLAVPANFIYKSNSPNQIILNGKDQLHCFTKILGWRKSKVKLLPSFRFIKSNKKFKKTIFLPLTIQNSDLLLDAIKYLCDEDFINLNNYKVKNHPAAFESINNINFMKKIKTLTQKYENKKKNNKNSYSIFIGNSGGIIEALEGGAKVIQICEHPVFDIYTDDIWPSILSKKIKDRIMIYQLKKKGNLIKFGGKSNNIKKFLFKL